MVEVGRAFKEVSCVSHLNVFNHRCSRGPCSKENEQHPPSNMPPATSTCMSSNIHRNTHRNIHAGWLRIMQHPPQHSQNTATSTATPANCSNTHRNIHRNIHNSHNSQQQPYRMSHIHMRSTKYLQQAHSTCPLQYRHRKLTK